MTDGATTHRDIAAEVIASLAAMVGREVAELSEETRLFDDLYFDSTSVLELLMRLEEDLGVEFDPETLQPADFEKVGSLVAYVRREAGA
ncbi:acyl carrier protein [Streptomyces sp. enrichment culture]|uniref:acyl carrier protein n=1 Tax=Streptomyces sp. enrichment culture TaxID=1795815 RepID=UPI003F5598BE